MRSLSNRQRREIADGVLIIVAAVATVAVLIGVVVLAVFAAIYVHPLAAVVPIGLALYRAVRWSLKYTSLR